MTRRCHALRIAFGWFHPKASRPKFWPPDSLIHSSSRQDALGRRFCKLHITDLAMLLCSVLTNTSLTDQDSHDFVEAPSMVPANCRTLADVKSFKEICEKEEEQGVRKSGRRRGTSQMDNEGNTAAAAAGEELMTLS
jgi:hypothetical protein